LPREEFRQLKLILHSELRRRAASRRALPCPSSYFLFYYLFMLLMNKICCCCNKVINKDKNMNVMMTQVLPVRRNLNRLELIWSSTASMTHSIQCSTFSLRRTKPGRYEQTDECTPSAKRRMNAQWNSCFSKVDRLQKVLTSQSTVSQIFTRSLAIYIGTNVNFQPVLISFSVPATA